MNDSTPTADDRQHYLADALRQISESEHQCFCGWCVAHASPEFHDKARQILDVLDQMS